MSRDIFSPRSADIEEAVFNEACGSGVVPSKDLITAQEVAELELQSAANFNTTEWLSSIIWAACTRASIRASKSILGFKHPSGWSTSPFDEAYTPDFFHVFVKKLIHQLYLPPDIIIHAIRLITDLATETDDGKLRPIFLALLSEQCRSTVLREETIAISLQLCRDEASSGGSSSDSSPVYRDTKKLPAVPLPHSRPSSTSGTTLGSDYISSQSEYSDQASSSGSGSGSDWDESSSSDDDDDDDDNDVSPLYVSSQEHTHNSPVSAWYDDDSDDDDEDEMGVHEEGQQSGIHRASLRNKRYESLLTTDEDAPTLTPRHALLRLEMTIPQKLFVVALMLACSWLDDNDTPLSTWAKVSRIRKDRLNRLHIAWLGYKGHNLMMKREEWVETLKELYALTTDVDVDSKGLEGGVVRRAGGMVMELIVQAVGDEGEDDGMDVY